MKDAKTTSLAKEYTMKGEQNPLIMEDLEVACLSRGFAGIGNT